MKINFFVLFVLWCFSTHLNGQCWKQVSVGGSYTLAIKSDGSLWAWGFNGSIQLGNNSPDDESSPVRIGTKAWKYISAGKSNSFAIDSEGNLYGWGSVAHDFLAVAGFPKEGKPVRGGMQRIFPEPIQIGNDKWKQVVVSVYHVLAIKEDGTLWAWGKNERGVLGLGSSITSVSEPTKVGVAKWLKVVATEENSAGIRNDGALFVWGNNYAGQIGNGEYLGANKYEPVQIGADESNGTFKDLAMNNCNGAAIGTDGKLYLWGGKNCLKDVDLSNGVKPYTEITSSLLLTSQRWKKVAGGSGILFAIHQDGALWAWGASSRGGLGSGKEKTDIPSPEKVIDGNWSEVQTSVFNDQFSA
ncbi:MAG: hypothetical protein AAF242_11210, partial [Bacteroidota bacterium]